MWIGESSKLGRNLAQLRGQDVGGRKAGAGKGELKERRSGESDAHAECDMS